MNKLCLNGCFQVLPVSAFGPHPHSSDGLASRCRPCEADRQMHLKHGVTRAHKAALADSQDGCAICGTHEPGGRGWVVDHDRSCCPGDRSCPSCRRGVLCHRCNSSLGYALDSPRMLRRMADYIELGTRLDPPSLHELEFKSDLMSDINTDGRTRTDGTKMNLRPTNQVTAVDAHAHTDSVGG